MKNLLLLLSIITIAACGSKTNNQVDSTNMESTSKVDGLEINPSNTVVNFEGSYDIKREFQNNNCPASINITRGCNGYILTSNTNQKENFCNVVVDGLINDRIPPNPDSIGVVVVTQKANQLKAVVAEGQNTYTNSLTLVDNNLTKITDYRDRSSVLCIFEKR